MNSEIIDPIKKHMMEIGRKGGEKSRRKISPKDQIKMQANRKVKTLEDRLKEHVVINKKTGCHEWTGARAGVGCGYFTEYRRGKKNKNIYIHRAVYARANGTIPENGQIMHRCDNPCCCNIDHLTLGTRSDNTRDMVEKGRHPKHMRKQKDEGVYIVKILGATPTYRASWKGDPGRTHLIAYATKYKTEHAAKIAKGMAEKYFPQRTYRIEEVICE